MTATEFIRNALQFRDKFSPQFFEDMRDAPLTSPTPRGGNHPLWILGHLALSEAGMSGLISGDANPLEHWAELFGQGTEPKTDPSVYPPYEEVYNDYCQVRARTLKLLDEVGEPGLDQPPKIAPEGMEEFFRTNADVFMVIIMHHQTHMGQIADARRAADRKPLLA